MAGPPGDGEDGDHGGRGHRGEAAQQRQEALAVDRLPDVGDHRRQHHDGKRLVERQGEGHEADRDRRHAHADGALGDPGNDESAGDHQHLKNCHAAFGKTCCTKRG
jgi:hypothetical protein